MQYRFKNSLISIVRDLQIQAEADWQPLQQAPESLPVHFIHGAQDKTIPIKRVSEFAKQRESSYLHTIDKAGNWMFGPFMQSVYSEVGKIATSD